MSDYPITGVTRTGAGVYLDDETVDELKTRLNRITGHVQSIIRMLEEQRDCEDLLIQMAAVKAAMNGVIIRTLEGHIATCVAECVVEGQGMEALERLQKSLALVLRKS
ncbi:MAG TPA: metal-sensitive transcriptional regulator [Chloroflexi bacterium]|nr:metal-sensitive transcriptional regulator [Chloroflexota bacterium]